MVAYDTFKFWYALSLGSNEFSDAATNRKIENKTTPSGEAISLIYVLPQLFSKRQTDVSNVLAADPTSPDTGTAISDVVIRFTQQRTVNPTVPVLVKLLEMFYLKTDDVDFDKARFGLESTDAPELDVLPIATAGYKFVSFRREPDQNTPAITIWELTLKFLGDHTKLGTRT